MYYGIYKIAGHVIEIVSLYENVHKQCSEYQGKGVAEFIIEVGEDDILVEQEKARNEDIKEGRTVMQYSEGYLETLAVYRKMAKMLIESNIVLFHGSVVAVDGEGYLFTAKSGIGKSTHTRLWMEEFKDRALMINDDKPLLHVTESGVFAYGTPWDGKHHLSTNTVVPLKAICVINRSENNYVEVMEKKKIYPMLIQQIYRSSDRVKLEKTLNLLNKIMEQVELYSIYCNMELEAARIAYEGMKGTKRIERAL